MNHPCAPKLDGGETGDLGARSPSPDMRAQFRTRPYRGDDSACFLKQAFDDVGAFETARRETRRD